jgi:hypothetical protein
MLSESSHKVNVVICDGSQELRVVTAAAKSTIAARVITTLARHRTQGRSSARFVD